MSSLQNQITEKFLASLTSEKAVTQEMAAALKEILASGKKLKADDLVEIFATPSGGTVS